MNSEPPAFSSDVPCSPKSSRGIRKQVRPWIAFSNALVFIMLGATEICLVPLLPEPHLIIIQIAVVALAIWMLVMTYLVGYLFSLKRPRSK